MARDKRARGRWRNAAGADLRGGGLTGEGQFGIPRLGLGRGLAVAHVRDMVNALAALVGLNEVRGGAGSAAAGRRAKRTGERRSAGLRGYDLIGLTQTEAWGSRVLTETCQGRSCGAGGSA